jgi:hypothetical protein
LHPLPNQAEYTWLKYEQHICNYEWARILLVDEGLDSKLQHCVLCKISWKKSKTLHSDCSGHIEDGVMQNCEKKKYIYIYILFFKVKKVKNQDFIGKTNFFFSTLSFSPWAILATWLHVGAPQKIHEKWA